MNPEVLLRLNPEILLWLLPYSLRNLQCPFKVFHSVLHNLPNKDECINTLLRQGYFGKILDLLQNQLKSRCCRAWYTTTGYLQVSFGGYVIGSYLADQGGFSFIPYYEHRPPPLWTPNLHGRLTRDNWMQKLCELEEVVHKCIWLEQQLCATPDLGWAKVEPRSDIDGWYLLPALDNPAVQVLGDRIIYNNRSFLLRTNIVLECHSIFKGDQLYCGIWFRETNMSSNYTPFEIPGEDVPIFWFYPNFVPNQQDPDGCAPIGRDEFLSILKSELLNFLERTLCN